MKMREYRKYYNSVLKSAALAPVKKQRICFVFMILVGILCLIPLICIWYNIFMQFIGIRLLLSISLIGCGATFHFFVSFLSSIYFISLNEFNEGDTYVENVSFKKIYLKTIAEWPSILFNFGVIIILIIIVNLIVF